MRLEDALQAHEEQVDTLLKEASKYLGALKKWKKACQLGHVGDLQKSRDQARSQAESVKELTQKAANHWQFDLPAYLTGEAWREELIEIARDRHGLRLLSELDIVLASPFAVKSQPGRARLLIGKQPWSRLRPSVVADELKRLKESVQEKAAQEFLEGLYRACEYLNQPKKDERRETIFAKFSDIYDLFCLTPDWKRDNSTSVFAQSIYALHLSQVKMTKKGIRFDIEHPSGNPKARDIFDVVSEDGRSIRYYGIHFVIGGK
ncbi:MAG: hypothetical protein KIT45_04195 [Fimbriimonadia bacterium]|nr:hypothetical protein [Fimbriimonadia bacterium]